VRIFVAVDIPESVRAAIGGLVERLRPACPEARWVRLAGVHVTLKFLGEVVLEKMASIQAALLAVNTPSPIEINFRNVGFFPNEHRPRVLWVGIEAAPALVKLAADIDAAMLPLGFPREERAFTPHLTLARFNHQRGVTKLQRALAAAGSLEFGHALATEFHLFESILKRGGAEYTRLATFPFTGSA
jgi:2'-5' RNA ligase